MTDNLSQYLEYKLMDHSLGTTTYTKPTTVYIALFLSSSGLEQNCSTNFSECTGGAYARQSATFNACNTSTGATDNAADITFPTATNGNWGTITHLAVCDSSTTNYLNVLWWGALTASKTVASGDTFKINSGDLDLTLS